MRRTLMQSLTHSLFYLLNSDFRKGKRDEAVCLLMAEVTA